MMLTKGDYTCLDAFNRPLWTVKLARSIHHSPVYPGVPWIIADRDYWVKWIDTDRRDMFIVPNVTRTIGISVSFDEFTRIFRGCNV